MELFRKLAEIIWAGAAVAVLAFFAVGTYVIWPYRAVPAQTAALTKAYTDAAPSKGHVDAGIDALKNVLPKQGSVDKLLDTATETVKAAQPVEGAAADAIHSASDEMIRKCKGPKGPDACGLSATIKKATIDAGDAIVTTQEQERSVAPRVIAAMDQFKLDAETLNADLKAKAIRDAAQNISRATGNLADDEATANGILLDVKKETDKMVAPRTKTQKVLSVLPPALKLGLIAGCLATGTPCP